MTSVGAYGKPQYYPAPSRAAELGFGPGAGVGGGVGAGAGAGKGFGAGNLGAGGGGRLGPILGWLKVLAWLLILLGVVMIIFGISCISVGSAESRYYCVDSSGLYTGLLAVAAGVLALIGAQMAKRYSFCQRCSLIAHVLVGILLVLASVSLIVMSSIYIASLVSYMNTTGRQTYSSSNTVLLLVFNIILLIAAILTLIVSAISSGVACCGCMRSRREPPVQINY